MQSKSATKKKTSKTAEAAATVPVELNAAPTRASKSSKPKSDNAETSSAKRHRPSKSAVPSEPAVVETTPETTPNPVQVVETTTALAVELEEAPLATHAPISVNEDEIRKLAYQFWIDRGQPHGSQHEDWLRAERVLSANA